MCGSWRFSGSIQPRVRIVPFPVAGYETSQADRFAFAFENAILSDSVGVPLIRTGADSGAVRNASRFGDDVAFASEADVSVALSTSVSCASGTAWKVSAPMPGAPPPRLSSAGADAGSGHSAYGVGFAMPQARLTIVPSATRCPVAVATGVASWTWVASGTAVISR